MKQVTQILRDSVINVKDVPVPGLGDKFVLVRNLASVISAGAVKTSVDLVRKNILRKTRARPGLLKWACICLTTCKTPLLGTNC